jgi:uncharacterized protein involved in exopolysaccharide biosynthesis
MESISADLAPYIRAIWKRKWFITVIVLLSAAISLTLGLREPKVFAATALIKVGRIWSEPVEDPYILTEIMNSQPFLARVSERLSGNRRPKELASALSAERLEGGRARNRYVYLIRITARGGTPEEAKELAKAAADQTIEESQKKFDAAFPAYEARSKTLKEKLDSLKSALASAGSSSSLGSLEAERLELQLVEQQLFETEMNNQSPLKTYRTQLAEEITAPKAVPGQNILKNLAMTTAAALAVALLGALALEFGLPVLKQSAVSHQPTASK